LHVRLVFIAEIMSLTVESYMHFLTDHTHTHVYNNQMIIFVKRKRNIVDNEALELLKKTLGMTFECFL